ncbi:MAG TPA: permease [Acidisarcina sp.]
MTIALIFWSQQRYPALLKKMHSGTSIQVKGAISFDALLKTTSDMPAPERVFRTGVNWLYTNRFGMYFALPFGAAMMTLFASSAAPRRFESAAGNVLCGAVAGAPLGVCTNCATPIGQSLLLGGASTRLTVAAMISSPSFNPVVLAMAFILFPLPIALARVIVPLVLLLALPLLVPESKPALRPITVPMDAEPVSERLAAFGRAFLRNLLRLTLRTLPWMLLAALIGGMAAELIPAYATHVPVSVPGVIAVAIFGTVLPVPMALDVALAFVLYHAGVPVPYVVALLCTLGPVSVYSITALSKHLGRSTGVRLASVTAALGAVAGLIALYLR